MDMEEPLKAAGAETLHTEAPWRVAGKATGHVHGKDVLVAIVGNYRDTELLRFNKDRWDADARLIAAAPDLLAALKELSALYDSIWTQMSDGEMELVREAWKRGDAAILKATSSPQAGAKP